MQKKHIPACTKKKSKISRKKVIISTAAVVLSLCALMVGMLAAKYRTVENSDGVVIAKNFYFTSNLLDGKKHTLAPGSTSVAFTLGNHEDDLRYSEVDIEYDVKIEDVTADSEEANGAKITTADIKVLQNGSVQDAKVTISDLQPGKTYRVTAVGTGGYTKTLTATIAVPEIETRLYYHMDNPTGEYILLTVWNEGDKAGEVTITYTGIPDNTNPDMAGWETNGSNKSVSIGPHESRVFRFFEAEAITVDGAAAEELY